MKKLLVSIGTAALLVAFLGLFSSCNGDVDKVKLDNQFAVSVFSGKVKVGDLLSGIGPGLSEFITVAEDGSICAYYADSVNDAVKASDILAGIQDIVFNTSGEFELPEIPALPIPIPSFDTIIEMPFNDFVSVPFEYEGYEINFVELKNGSLYLNLSTNMELIKGVVLKTDNIKLGDGSSLEFNLDFFENPNQTVDFDLTNCVIEPKDKSITFSAVITLKVSDQGMAGGLYSIDLNGGIYDVEFKNIDGAIQDCKFDFVGTHDFNFSIPNMQGELKIATPEFSIKYVNTFGFNAEGIINSLYLSDSIGNITQMIKEGEKVELLLHPTSGAYDSISNLGEKLVDEINILQGFDQLTFNGEIILGCDEVTDNMITEDSRIDVIADLTIPLEFKMNDLRYTNKFNFNLSLNEDENAESEGVHLDNIFDELEFKFVFNNAIPIQIVPQMYLLENGAIIDSLFDEKASISGNFDDIITEDILLVHVTGKKLENVQRADQLLLDINLSSEGKQVMLNANDYFDLKIGLKTKTSEIDMSMLNQ